MRASMRFFVHSDTSLTEHGMWKRVHVLAENLQNERSDLRPPELEIGEVNRHTSELA